MTTETKLRGGLVLTILILLWFTLMWSNGIVTIEEQKNTIDSLNVSLDSVQCIKDSLYEEHFISSVMNGRYEITLENFKETNPQAAKQFVDFFYSQTE
jgi:predicted transcriptional regulator of viral defense system